MSRIGDSPGNSRAHEPAGATPDAGDTRFEARAREVLIESVDSLDGRTRSRLTQARHAALEQLESGATRPMLVTRWLVPVGGLAAAVLVAVLWFGGSSTVELTETGQSDGLTAQTGAAGSSPLDELAIMADAEGLDLLEEIEFYAWLDAEAALPPLAAGGVG